MKTLSIFVVLMFLLSTVSVIAQDTNETTTVQVGKEYTTLDSVLDRIRLAFTFQEERKVELINKIEQRREQHYSFLVAKGKTEQAEKFKAKTIGLVKNFEQWKAKKAENLVKMETNVEEQKSADVNTKLTREEVQIEQRAQAGKVSE